MPAIQPISLAIGEATEVYNPSMNTGAKTTFVNSSEVRFADNKMLSATIRPAGLGNTGHRADWLGVRPLPVADVDGCCVDKDQPPSNTFTIGTLLRKESSSAQADELIAAIRSFVNSTEFAATVKGQSFY